MADIRLPFEFPDTPEKVQANFQAMYDFISNVEDKVETFTNLEVSDGSTVKFTTDDDGNVTQPVQPSFLATAPGSQVLTEPAVGSNNTTITFDSEIYDPNSNYDGTNTFTAPKTGKYLFTINLTLLSGGGAITYTMGLVTSNRSYALGPLQLSATQNSAESLAVLADMDANDTAFVRISISSNGADTMTIGSTSNFCGTLIN